MMITVATLSWIHFLPWSSFSCILSLPLLSWSSSISPRIIVDVIIIVITTSVVTIIIIFRLWLLIVICTNSNCWLWRRVSRCQKGSNRVSVQIAIEGEMHTMINVAEISFGVEQLLFPEGRRCKKELFYSKSHFSLHVKAKQRKHVGWFLRHKI